MPKNSTKTGEKPPTKRRRGAPAFEPTQEQRYSVELMAGIGIPQTDIASALGITDNTLRKYFPDELKNGRTRTIAKVADSLVRQALAGNTTAMIFYLKTQARWSETHKIEHSGSVSELTDEQLEAIAASARDNAR